MDSSNPEENPRSDAQNWAKPVDVLRVGGISSEAVNLNVEGRRVTGPVRGFGQLWQKTYQIVLEGQAVDPRVLIREWKANFTSFWPKGNRYYGPDGTMTPGSVAVLNLAGPGGVTAPGGAPVISTGILVVYADEEFFTFITPEGHILSGIITFSAAEEAGRTSAQIDVMIRPSDPIYELMFRLGIGHTTEDTFWLQVLRNLASYFHAQGIPTMQARLVDPKVQWSEFKNIWHNSAIRTVLYLMASPFRWVGKKMKGS